MQLFLTEEQAAALLGVDVETVRSYLDAGELTRSRDGISSAEVAAWLLEREREGR